MVAKNVFGMLLYSLILIQLQYLYFLFCIHFFLNYWYTLRLDSYLSNGLLPIMYCMRCHCHRQDPIKHGQRIKISLGQSYFVFIKFKLFYICFSLSIFIVCFTNKHLTPCYMLYAAFTFEIYLAVPTPPLCQSFERSVNE